MAHHVDIPLPAIVQINCRYRAGHRHHRKAVTQDVARVGPIELWRNFDSTIPKVILTAFPVHNMDLTGEQPLLGCRLLLARQDPHDQCPLLWAQKQT